MIERLILEDFMSVNNADIDFINGVTLITGENGLGKSAPLDAIAICLTDGYKRSDTILDYIQKGKNQAKIKLWVYYYDEPLFFDIVLSKNKGTFFQRAVTYKNQVYTMAEASNLLAGLDFTYYSDILLTMQDSENITKLSPAQRATYLQRLLNFDFSKQINIIDKKLDELAAQKLYNENQISFQETEINTRSTEIKKETPLPFSLDEYSEFTDLYEKARKEILDIQDKQTQYLELSNKLSEAKLTQSSLTSSIAIKEKALKDWDVINSKKLTLELEIKENSEKLDALEKEIESTKLEKFSLQDQNIFQEQISELTVNETKLISKLTYDNEKLKLIEGGSCPTCAQPTSNLGNGNIQKEVQETQVKLAEITEIKKELILDSEDLKKRLDEVKKNEIALERKKAVASSVIDHKKIELENINIQLEKSIDKSSLEKEKEELQNYVESINEIEKQISVLNYNQENLAKYKKQEEDNFNKVSSYNTTSTQNQFIKEHNDQVNKAIKILETNIETNKETIISLSKDLMLNDEAKKFINKKLSNYLIVKTCKALETAMNDFMQVVFPNMAVRLFQNKKGVEFFYTLTKDSLTENTTKEDLINVKMASGFQKEILSIAFRVALCQAYGIQLLILDECDKAASDNSSSKLFEAILGDELFNQVVIITHKPAVKDYIISIAENVKTYTPENGEFVEVD